MASKRGIRRRECGTKGRYTRKQAHAHAQWLRRKTGHDITHYHCQHCGCWHVGHQSQKIVRLL